MKKHPCTYCQISQRFDVALSWGLHLITLHLPGQSILKIHQETWNVMTLMLCKSENAFQQHSKCSFNWQFYFFPYWQVVTVQGYSKSICIGTGLELKLFWIGTNRCLGLRRFVEGSALLLCAALIQGRHLITVRAFSNAYGRQVG